MQLKMHMDFENMLINTVKRSQKIYISAFNNP